MCGRFTLSAPAKVVAELFELVEEPALTPRYNIAPTQPAPVVLWNRELKRRQFDLLHWGLIPVWADDPSIGSRMINARAETVGMKPAFRSAFRHRRCLIVADGFYEWQKLQRGKQPFYIRMENGGPFALAGLWERWEGADGTIIDSCTILTTEPNEVLRPLHNRMPVVLHSNDHGRWLDAEIQEADSLKPLLCPYSGEKMTAHPVSTRVNNPANDGPSCIEPLR
jgi:putative SOS response-associated peptidase YedK